MATINASDLGGEWLELLKRLRAGEQITIEQNGEAVARVIPETRNGVSHSESRASLDWMRAFRSGNRSVGTQELAEWRHEGRRH